MINYKEIVCNNDIINDYFKRQEYIKNQCISYDYVVKEHPNSDYHILKNSNVKISSKEFLQKMFYDVFLKPLEICKFWNVEYSFNYLHSDFTTILQVVVFWNENQTYSQLDFEGDLQTLKDIEYDKIQNNFVTFQNQCILCLRDDVINDFVNKEEHKKVCNLEKEFHNYLENKYSKDEYLEKSILLSNHFSTNYHNLGGEDFNIVQTFGGDNFDGFLITDTEQ